MAKSIFLMNRAEESRLFSLGAKITSALQIKDGMALEEYMAFLSNREAVKKAIQDAGIDIPKEAAALAKKAKEPSFSLDFETDPKGKRTMRLCLYTSSLPTTEIIVPDSVGIYDVFDTVRRSDREEQAQKLKEIRDILSAAPGIAIPADSRYMDILSWSMFFDAYSILNSGIAHEAITSILSVGGKRIKEFDFPLDKVNANVWKLLEKDMHGQLAFGANKATSKKEISILYSINFDDLGNDITITKRLEAYDKRVYMAVAALFNAGNQVITTAQIYDAMGFNGNPGKADIMKISASISKMTAARIYIDNSEEAAAYKYDRFKYDASLLPMERVKAIVNGQEVESAIHLFREPPLISFARQRKQITTLSRKLLTTPLSKTSQNLSLEEYLIERIAHAKRGNLSAKILYITVYEQVGITGKQRQRTPDKIKRLMRHYQDCGFIASFSEEPDGIRVTW